MARDLGANASLIKPFDIDDLVAEVNRLLGNNNSPRQAKQDITIK
jgi:DNA-binding response OmpR family regulator